MTARHTLLALLFVLALLLSAMPAANAQRPCADALGRCNAACNEQFGGGGFFGSFMAAGCEEGCGIGYLWCAASN
jgi:hypothetical protein